MSVALRRALAAAALIASAAAARAQDAGSAACAPVDSAAPPRPAALAPGRYALTVVATAGSERGRRAAGRLTLRPTAPGDRSPRTGRGPVGADVRGAPLYGWTDVDLWAVGAPVAPPAADTVADTLLAGGPLFPAPTSRDPIRPGVLVLTQTRESDTLPRQPVLVIGTISNLRDVYGGEDGAGVGLWVRRVAGRDFAGTWGAWGILTNGSGHFCARFLGR